MQIASAYSVTFFGMPRCQGIPGVNAGGQHLQDGLKLILPVLEKTDIFLCQWRVTEAMLIRRLMSVCIRGRWEWRLSTVRIPRAWLSDTMGDTDKRLAPPIVG